MRQYSRGETEVEGKLWVGGVSELPPGNTRAGRLGDWERVRANGPAQAQGVSSVGC